MIPVAIQFFFHCKYIKEKHSCWQKSAVGMGAGACLYHVVNTRKKNTLLPDGTVDWLGLVVMVKMKGCQFLHIMPENGPIQGTFSGFFMLPC